MSSLLVVDVYECVFMHALLERTTDTCWVHYILIETTNALLGNEIYRSTVMMIVQWMVRNGICKCGND